MLFDKITLNHYNANKKQIKTHSYFLIYQHIHRAKN